MNVQSVFVYITYNIVQPGFNVDFTKLKPKNKISQESLNPYIHFLHCKSCLLGRILIPVDFIQHKQQQ